MKWRSEKGSRLNRIYEHVKLASRLAMPQCVRCQSAGTERNPLTTDHCQGRNGVGNNRLKLLISPAHFQTLCLVCHRWVTDNRSRLEKLDFRTAEQKGAMEALEKLILKRLPELSGQMRWTDGDLHIAVISGVDEWKGSRS